MKNRTFSAPLGASLIVISSFFYASYGIWTKLLGNFFDGYTATVLRSILVVIILGSLAVLYRKFEPLHLKKNWIYIAGLFIASLFTWGPLYYAILFGGVGISLAVNYACIVIGTFFFAWIFASERFTKDKAYSAILGIIGLVLIFSPTFSSLAWLPIAAACLSGLSSGANNVFLKKVHYNPTQSTLVGWTSGIIANLLMAFVLGKSYPSFRFQIQWFYLLLFAIASVISSWFFVKGLKLIDAGAAGILGLLEIVFGVILGVVLFHEKPSLIALFGIALIIIAAAIPYSKDYNSKKGTLE